MFEAKPLEMFKQDDGEYMFTNTGDPLMDKWEEQIAMGEIPDLLEGMTEADRDQLLKKLDNLKKKHTITGGTFGDVARQIAREQALDPRLDSVLPAPGQKGPMTKTRKIF